ncbi:flippase-like domain-containing protein [Candidatus Poribacteria bacterium]|nr:flippase-like domain-containing protein [Candidatus Poribacteria bacterium]
MLQFPWGNGALGHWGIGALGNCSNAPVLQRSNAPIVGGFTATCFCLIQNFIHRVEINNATFTFLSRTTILIFGAIFFLFLLSLIKPSAFENGIRRLLDFLSPIKRFLERRGWLESFLKGVREYHNIVGFYLREGKMAFIISTLLTAIIYFNKFSIAYVVVRGMGFNPSYVNVLYIQMLLFLIFYFAPSPGASGVAEMSAATFMGLLIPKNSQAIFVVLWRTFTLYLGMVIGGSIFMKYLLKNETSN